MGRSNQDLQRKVSNVIELMRSHKIKHFKVDSMRRYLRKMMDWKKKNMSIIKKVVSLVEVGNLTSYPLYERRNKLLKSQYEKTGMIDFYYI